MESVNGCSSSDLVVQVPHEGRTWTLMRQGMENKIADRELARQLEADVWDVRQRTDQLMREDTDFRPEFVKNLNDSAIPHERRGKPGRPEIGQYRFTFEEAMFVTSRIRTPVARQRTRQMIRVFYLVATGQHLNSQLGSSDDPPITRSMLAEMVQSEVQRALAASGLEPRTARPLRSDSRPAPRLPMGPQTQIEKIVLPEIDPATLPPGAEVANGVIVPKEVIDRIDSYLSSNALSHSNRPRTTRSFLRGWAAVRACQRILDDGSLGPCMLRPEDILASAWRYDIIGAPYMTFLLNHLEKMGCLVRCPPHARRLFGWRTVVPAMAQNAAA